MTHDEWKNLPEKATSWVIIPTASIEQHGPHLPVGVDSLLGHAWATEIVKRFPAGARVYVTPPITYGKSNEHLGYPGTLSISGKTLRRILLALATELKQAGFRQIAVLNSHGGNTATLTYTLREIQTTLGLRAGMLGQPYKPELSAQESELGFHAGEWETSLMLAIASDLVRMDKAVSEYPAKRESLGQLRVDGGAAYLSWMTADISESGVMGDAKAATIEKGQQWLEAGSAALARKIDALGGK
ncbi:creatininase [Opitutaceae bacterium EW11]|nr:creatininase [Opitutaceae bacterium EW11]